MCVRCSKSLPIFLYFKLSEARPRGYETTHVKTTTQTCCSLKYPTPIDITKTANRCTHEHTMCVKHVERWPCKCSRTELLECIYVQNAKSAAKSSGDIYYVGCQGIGTREEQHQGCCKHCHCVKDLEECYADWAKALKDLISPATAEADQRAHYAKVEYAFHSSVCGFGPFPSIEHFKAEALRNQGYYIDQIRLYLGDSVDI